MDVVIESNQNLLDISDNKSILKSNPACEFTRRAKTDRPYEI